MFKPKSLVHAIACTLLSLSPYAAHANDSSELESLRAELQEMKQQYENRIKSLEAKIQQTETVANDAAKTADTAVVKVSARPTSSNAFNPDLSLILTGTYANRSQDSDYHITGFQSGGEIGPGSRSFSLGESELGIYANIDHYFYGGLNLALAPDNSIGVEEAFIQTTSLPYGFTLKGGRFFSGIGYLNEQHAHTWDFVDNPLAYQAFLGNQYGDDGLQLRWLAPTETFLEFGAEIGRGRIAETEGRYKNGSSATAIFAHIGGDIGLSNSWRAGISYLQISPTNRESQDLDLSDTYVTNSFTGRSKIWIADAVWKWAPNGNNTNTSFKLQGEYLHRNEKGSLENLSGADDYSASQSGWYIQGIYKFLPEWRTGLRYDELDSGSIDYGLNTVNLADTHYKPKRISWMLDYNPSEFSRVRLQLSRDESRQSAPDNQIFIQYQMSLGAHGAHKY